MDRYFLDELNRNSLKQGFDYEVNKEMEIESLINKEVLNELGLQYAIVYCYDRIITDSVARLELDIDNIMEIRAFNEVSELRVWREENGFRGSIFKELESSISPIEEKYLLYPRKTGGSDPEELLVKKYIEYDEDGQAYIIYTKPSEFKGGDI